MFWKSKKLKKRIETDKGMSYGKIVFKRFRRDSLTRWSLRLFYLLVFVGLFSDFIANEKPIYCKVDGKTHYPIVEDYLVNLGLLDPMNTLGRPNWRTLEHQGLVLPIIPYSAHKPDQKNMGFSSPFGKQNIESSRYRHWLGTDRIGRDLAAGLVAGTRIALAVGIIAMGIASLIGIVLGLLAGYFGDNQVRISLLRVVLILIGLCIGLFWGFISRSYALKEGALGIQILISLGILLLCVLGFFGLSRLMENMIPGMKKVYLPFDLIIMRMVEIVDAMPAILLILAATSIIRNPSIYNVMIIIGLVSWTTIARFVRAEVIKVREQDYIQAAKALAYSDFRIITRHILPNSIGPVLIVIAFGMAGAILAEATISFLGIGLDDEDITWGYLLNQARGQASAWWLAIFPGIAIFITVTLFNLLGEGLTKALNPKLDT